MSIFNKELDIPSFEYLDSEFIGSRIRKIRTAQGMSQAELGKLVDLPPDRIQKYESGTRTPKEELTSKIANALNVNVRALLDPEIDDPLGLMYCFFEMEYLYGLKLKKIDGQIYLYIEDDMKIDLDDNKTYPTSSITKNHIINSWLNNWYERQQERQIAQYGELSNSEKKQEQFDYNMWEWNFPTQYNLEERKKQRKMKLRQMINQLENELNEIED